MMAHAQLFTVPIYPQTTGPKKSCQATSSTSASKTNPATTPQELSGLLQPSQPRQCPPSIQLRAGYPQSQNSQPPGPRAPRARPVLDTGHPDHPRNNPNGCAGCRSGAEMISRKCTASQSWTAPRSALTGAAGAAGAGFLKKTFFHPQSLSTVRKHARQHVNGPPPPLYVNHMTITQRK